MICQPTHGAKVEPATVNVAPAGTGAKKIKGPAATKPAKVAKIQPQNSVYINGPAAYSIRTTSLILTKLLP